MNKFAPVFIITLNRYEHFRQCVESLSECADADKTDLYIALDYPLNDSHWDGYKKISNYIEKIQGFKNIHIIKRNSNYGASRNFFETMAEIYEKHDRLIYTEDDNVFSPSFLKFINDGLNTYETRQDIFAVAGYNSPFPMPVWYKNDVFLFRTFAAWGVGLWREKWNRVNWSVDCFRNMLEKKENYIEIKRNYQRYLNGFLQIRDSGNIKVDSYIFLYLLDNNMYSVCPVVSRVRNTGHDGSGMHGGYSDLYSGQEIYLGNRDAVFPPDLVIDNKLSGFLLKNIQPSLTEKLKSKIPAPIKEALKRIIKI